MLVHSLLIEEQIRALRTQFKCLLWLDARVTCLIIDDEPSTVNLGNSDVMSRGYGAKWIDVSHNT